MLVRLLSVAAIGVSAFQATSFAAPAAGPPTVMTVPFLASNPTSPHTSWPGNTVTLKGTFSSPNLGADTFTWVWNAGDPANPGAGCTGTVDTSYQTSGVPGDNPFIIQCSYTYSGAVGTVYTAILTVTDTGNGLTSPNEVPNNCPPSVTSGGCYYTSLQNAGGPAFTCGSGSCNWNLPVEVNNAIDNGLWTVHTAMNRTTSGGGAPIGNWYGGAAGSIASGNLNVQSSGDTGPSALYCTSFEDSGFLVTNNPPNPYSADVSLCLAGVFDQLGKINIGSVTTILPTATFNPDKNSNGIGVQQGGSGSTNYQTGMMLDSIAAAGTAAYVNTTPVPLGTALGGQTVGLGTGAGGQYLYKDAVQDMVDDYSYCENIGSNTNEFGAEPNYFGNPSPAGGWHYTCQESDAGDNSVSQWAAIGIIPARRLLSSVLDPTINSDDLAWLDLSFSRQGATNGYFGYTSNSPIWGPYADTPSGLVQLAMNGYGRGTTSPGGNNLWDSAETYIRDNFGVTGSDPNWGYNSLKDYYYGMFSFTKSMLLHDNSLTGLSNTPITLLQSLDDPGTCAAPGVPVTSPGSGSGPCYPPIDWYAAQSSTWNGSDPTDGVARTLVSEQNGDGSWYNHNVNSQQYYFETAVAIIMLNKTVFNPVPVACFTSNPTHVANGGPVILNGGCSVEQNPANTLVSWQWNISGTPGNPYTLGPSHLGGPLNPKCLNAACSQIQATFSTPTPPCTSPGVPAGCTTLPYNYPVQMLLTDSGGLTATVVGNVVIANPPNPPDANAGGPYNFCPNTVPNTSTLIYAPFTLDGSASTNPDQGKTDGTLNAPPSTIVSYLWDYSCSGAFNSASGAQVNATSAFDVPADFGTTFNICLQVTNNDNLAFPTAGLAAGLSSVASAQVTIHNPTDEACDHCVQTLSGKVTAGAPNVPGNIQLYWTDTNTSAAFPIAHYNIYRSTSPTFTPYTQIVGAASNPFIPAVQAQAPPGGGTLEFTDKNVVGGTTYYYRIAPATANDTETCQGNVTLSATYPRVR